MIAWRRTWSLRMGRHVFFYPPRGVKRMALLLHTRALLDHSSLLSPSIPVETTFGRSPTLPAFSNRIYFPMSLLLLRGSTVARSCMATLGRRGHYVGVPVALRLRQDRSQLLKKARHPSSPAATGAWLHGWDNVIHTHTARDTGPSQWDACSHAD